MLYVFANGTAKQQSLWQEAHLHLMHLPSASYPLRVEVKFVDPTEVDPTHTDFAMTYWEYGSPNAETFIRDDGPAFGPLGLLMRAEAARLGLRWNADRFFMETAVHELGHALFAALPEEFRVAIARLFGAASDSPEELQPEGKPWQDHIAEAIAETFKEAFLPRKFRVFPNRTNIHLGYTAYKQFRQLFRAGCSYISNTAGAVGESGSGTGEEEVPGLPEYDFDIFERGGFTAGPYTDARGGLYSGVETITGDLQTFHSEAQFQAEKVLVGGGHKFKLVWNIPRSFLEPATGQTIFRLQFIAQFPQTSPTETYARWELHLSTRWATEAEKEIEEEAVGSNYQGFTATRAGKTETEYFIWIASVTAVNETGALVNAPTIALGTGIGGLLPPFTLTCEFATSWKPEETKTLAITTEVRAENLGKEMTQAEFEEAFVRPFRESIPDFHFKQGVEEVVFGFEPEVPQSSLAPGEARNGSRKVDRPAAGVLAHLN